MTRIPHLSMSMKYMSSFAYSRAVASIADMSETDVMSFLKPLFDRRDWLNLPPPSSSQDEESKLVQGQLFDSSPHSAGSSKPYAASRTVSRNQHYGPKSLTTQNG